MAPGSSVEMALHTLLASPVLQFSVPALAGLVKAEPGDTERCSVWGTRPPKP